MTFKRDEINAMIGVAVGFPILFGIGWGMWGPVVTIPALGVMFVALLAIGLGGIRRLRGELQESLQQTQALLFVNSQLDLKHPLPSLGGAALLPDSAAMLIGLIKEQRPQLIVELGSGVSTLVCAYALEGIGEGGRIVSLDHDDFYGDITRENLRRHGLEEFAEVRHAPIEPTLLDGEEWQWYATSQLPTGQPIDLLIVDGPPKKIQHLARYPAAKVLFDRLAKNCTILVDDTNREQEREIVRRWTQELPGFAVTEIASGEGTTLLQRAA